MTTRSKAKQQDAGFTTPAAGSAMTQLLQLLARIIITLTPRPRAPGRPPLAVLVDNTSEASQLSGSVGEVTPTPVDREPTPTCSINSDVLQGDAFVAEFGPDNPLEKLPTLEQERQALALDQVREEFLEPKLDEVKRYKLL